MDIVFSWQTLVLAILVFMASSASKAILDFALGGTGKRKKNRFLTKLAVPAIPVLFGGAFGAWLPLHPEMLLDYVKTYEVSMLLVGGSYGAVVGLFNNGLYKFVKNRMRAANGGADSKESS